MKNYLILLLIICGKNFPLTGQPLTPFNPEKYLCRKVEEALTIDGIINEKGWESADWTKDFVDIEGNKKPLPKHRTRVKMLWDDNFFYIGAELIEPDIWCTYTERDAIIYHENDFEVFIDPDGDTHHYYELEINALGTVWDLLLSKPYRDKGNAINSWDIDGLLKGIHIDGTLNNPEDVDEKWTVELAIPWEAMKEANGKINKPSPGDIWRVNFSRVNWQLVKRDGKYEKRKNFKTKKEFPEFNWVWSAQGVIAMHRPETWGFVQFAYSGDSIITIPKDENIKWALRQIYYKEWEYFKLNKSFTDDLQALELPEIKLEDIEFYPDIKLAPGAFLVNHKSYDPAYIWQISEDGRVWRVNEKLKNRNKEK